MPSHIMSKNKNKSQIKYFVKVAVVLLPLVAAHKQTHVTELKAVAGISLVIPASWADMFLNQVIYLTLSQTIWTSNISFVLLTI